MPKNALPVLLLLLSAALMPAQPVLEFEPGAVKASGVTPGAGTVWLAVSHEPRSYNLRVSQRASILTDDDRDGAVRLGVDRPVSQRSVWIVLDLVKGAMGLAAPGPARLRRTPLAPGSIRPGAGGGAAQIVVHHEYLFILYVRPGAGAWLMEADDGTSTDGDMLDDGHVSVPLHRMQPVGDSPSPPVAFAAGDVVIGVDPMTLEIFDLRVRE